MKTRQITAANADEKIKRLYETAFPEGEQIPWNDLMRLVGEMPLDFTAYYDEEEFIGFTIVYPRISPSTGTGTLRFGKNCEGMAMVRGFLPS